MGDQSGADTVTDKKFRILSVATLLKKVRDGITFKELYRNSERKFDTLIDLLTDTSYDNDFISTYGYSMDELKQFSLLIFHRLISESDSNPYMTLCVSEEASLEEVKRRRNKLLNIFHPDRSWVEFSDGIKTQRINEAYEIIVHKNNNRNMPFNHAQTNIPPVHTYNRRHTDIRLILLLIIVILLIAFVGIMKINNLL